MTVINRRHKFVYLKSRKTAGTSIEVHLLTSTPWEGDIWRSASEVTKHGLPNRKRRFVLNTHGSHLLTAPAFVQRLWPQRLRIREHHHAGALSRLLGGFWDTALKATSVRNPWDLMVSAWSWSRAGRGGHAEPITTPFHEWLAASVSHDPEWRSRVAAYDAREMVHPFVFIDERCAVDVLIRQEAINEGLADIGRRLGLDLGTLASREKRSPRRRDYRSYYTDELAEAVGRCFEAVIELCAYDFD